MAEQIRKRGLISRLAVHHLDFIRLPRLLLLANFWGQFYLNAKYGFEAGFLAPAADLFAKEDADLAISHAEECHRMAWQLRYVGNDKLAAIISQDT